MNSNPHLTLLKIKLQHYGALRPEAWERIVQLCQQTNLKPNESLIRKPDTLAYVANGLLKEYNAQHRKSPSIINFIGHKKSLITRKHNQNHYLKAAMSSIVYYRDLEDLQQLYQEFKELKFVFDALVAEYDESVHFRMRLLELPVHERIVSFQERHTSIDLWLKKKDIANYLHISYAYLVDNW